LEGRFLEGIARRVRRVEVDMPSIHPSIPHSDIHSELSIIGKYFIYSEFAQFVR
jgi:hypothetical protein